MQIKDDLSKHLYLSISKKEIQAKIEQNVLADNQNVAMDTNAKNNSSFEKKKRKNMISKNEDPYKEKKLELVKTENKSHESANHEVILKKLNAI